MNKGRPRLLLIWSVLLVLVGTIVALEWNQKDSGQGIGYTQRMLMPAPMEELTAIEVGHVGVMHRFERDGSGTWFYHGVHAGSEQDHSHQTDPEAAKRIDLAMTGFGRAQLERELPLSSQGNPYGIATPQVIILVYGPSGTEPLGQYAVGDLAPDGLSRYIRPMGSHSVFTIPDYQIQNLLSLIQSFSSPTR